MLFLFLLCPSSLRADNDPLVVMFESPVFPLDTRIASGSSPSNLVVQFDSPVFAVDTRLSISSGSLTALVVQVESPVFVLDTRISTGNESLISLVVRAESPVFVIDTRLTSGGSSLAALVVQAESAAFTLDTRLSAGSGNLASLVVQVESPVFALDTRLTTTFVPGPPGIAESAVFTLDTRPEYVLTFPAIITEPRDTTNAPGATVSFNVDATGRPPLGYQWQFNGTNLSDNARISGARGNVLAISNLQLADAGGYSVIVSNSFGSVTSSNALLVVDAQPPIISQVNVTPGDTFAEIAWRTDEPATAAVEYGLTPAYGATNAFAALLKTNHILVLTRLLPETTYHFRLRPTDAFGNSAATSDATFTTLAAPDLVVSNLSVNATPALQSGADVTVTWRDANPGGGSLNSPFLDRVQVRNLSTSEQFADAFVSGAPATNSFSFRLPDGLRGVGTLEFTVTADSGNAVVEANTAGTGESNNIAVLTRASALPPYPDLAVTNIIGPTSGLPGQVVQISWMITNRGAATAIGPWSEQVFLSDDFTVGNDTPLASFGFGTNLAAGAFVIRTQQVALPFFGSSNRWLIVRADAGNNVFELDETNNTGVAAQPMNIPAALALTFSQSDISENAGSNALTATVTRNSDTAGALEISFITSPPGRLNVPAGVTIPAGQASTTTALGTVDNALADGDVGVETAASASGHAAAVATVTLVDDDQSALRLAVSPTTFSENGGGAVATVFRNSPTNAPLTISVLADKPAKVSVPNTVVIPAGSTSATFSPAAVDNALLDGTHQVVLSVSAANHAGAAQTLTVTDDEAQALALVFDVTAVAEGGPSPAAIGTVLRTYATGYEQAVRLASSDASLSLPLEVTIPANQEAVSFPVSVLDDAVARGTRTVTNTARLVAGGQPVETAAAIATLAVYDDDGATLQLESPADALAEGETAILTLRRNTDPAASLAVTLSSSPSNQLNHPPMVTIPVGAETASMIVTGAIDAVTDGRVEVTLTAAASGFNNGVAHLSINDIDLPDLRPAGVTLPANGFTGGSVPLTWAITNSGRAEAAGTWLDRVYVSTDDQVGGDTLLLSVSHTGPLAVGAGYTVARQIVLPNIAGRYWIVVETDGTGSVEEGSERNNAAVWRTPIDVSPSYVATVQTTLEAAPNGTPVPITGEASDAVSGAPATNKPVAVRVLTRGTRRVLNVVTDAQGRFATVFQPLPFEGGYYQLAAAHPGVAEDVPQDAFVLLAMEAVPSQLSARVSPGAPQTGEVLLRNLTEVPLTGLTVTVEGAPAYLQVQPLVPAQLGPTNSASLSCQLTVTQNVRDQGRVVLRVASAEGARLAVTLDVTIDPLAPQLAAEPALLQAGMVRGEQKLVTCDVVNRGTAASGDLTVHLPAATWLALESPSNIPSLAPGDSARLTFALRPAADLPLQRFDGTIVLRSALTELSVPFQFRAVSAAVGDVEITVVDDYTFHAVGAPKVSGARVTLRDPYETWRVLAEGFTDTNGVARMTNVMEGPYALAVEASQHGEHRSTLEVGAGVVTTREVFIKREVITYRWVVEPTLIEDRYEVRLETTFEANVPVPVVTMEVPPQLPDLAPGEQTQIDVTLINHGLLAAEDVRLRLPEGAGYEFNAVSTSLGTLPAKSTITVPVTVRRSSPPGAQAKAMASEAQKNDLPLIGSNPGCVIWLGTLYYYRCGTNRVYVPVSTGIQVGIDTCAAQALFDTLTYFLGGGWDIGGGSGGFNGCFGCGAGGGTTEGTVFEIPLPKIEATSCDPCKERQFVAVLNCVIKFTPIGDAKDAYDCITGSYGFWTSIGERPSQKQLDDWKKMVTSCISLADPVLGNLNDAYECYTEYRDACKNLPPDAQVGKKTLLIRRYGASSSASEFDTTELDIWAGRLKSIQDWAVAFLGDTNWIRGPADGASLQRWMTALQTATADASEDGQRVSSAERDWLATNFLPASVTVEQGQVFLDRWNRTVDYWNAGVLNLNDVPAGMSTNFIAFDVLGAATTGAAGAIYASEAAGYPDPLQGFAVAFNAVKESLASEPGVCATVRLRIEQQAVLTRNAFLGTLEIENGSAAQPVSGIRVVLDIRDELGQSADGRFFVRGPELNGLTGVDGSGVVAAAGSGSARFTFIPARAAAPEQPTVYHIGGTLRYLDPENGLEVVKPLIPSAITVYPDPRLELDYFQQRDVFSDDPFTEEVEPGEPFSLGLLARNTGRGAARNFRITSAQPKIIENEKGLLIDFKIVGTQVGANAVSPSLTVNLGDIAPGSSQIARWIMTSTLQGKFIDYKASFEHSDELGGLRTSLIDSVRIHELIHVAQADRPGDDALPDFLVNDVPDLDNFPDTLFLSSGGSMPVSLASNPSVDGQATTGDMQVQLTATMTPGWNYLKVTDPGAGFRLWRARRSDGKEIRAGDNAWTTDRSFPSSLTGAVRERLFHLLDFDGTGSYTLFYRVDDSVAPTITALSGVANVENGPVSSADVAFSETIDLSTFDYADLRLTRNGGANLITSSATLSQVSSNVYRVSGLAAITTLDGNYELTVMGAGIQDFGGNPCANSLSVSWSKGTGSPVVVSISPVTPNPRSTAVASLDVVFSKPLNLATVGLADFALARDGGVNLLNDSATLTPLSSTSVRLGGLQALTAGDGLYALTASAAGVQDTDGNSGTGSLTRAWTKDSTGPAVANLETVATNPRNTVLATLDVTFSEAIAPASFDFQDLTLTRDAGANLITAAVTVTPVSTTTFRIANFNWVVGAEGNYTLTVNASSVMDPAGNSGSGSASRSWIMDTTPPAAATNLTASPDTGISTSDGLLNANALTFSGTLAESNLTVRVADATGGADFGEANVTGTNFSKPLQLASAGTHRLRARTMDTAGNVGPDSFFDVFLDLAQPGAAFAPVSPNPRASALSALDVTFTEPINSATLDFHDVSLSRDGAPVTLTSNVTAQVLSSNVFRLAGLATFTDAVGAYRLILDLSAVEDLAGNAGSGEVEASWRRTLPNQPPVLAAISNRVVAPNVLLVFTNVAGDPDVPPNNLRFSLEPGAPPEARIDTRTGVFSWKPPRTAGSSTVPISVRVTDDGDPPLSDVKTFSVQVLDYLEIGFDSTALLAGQNGQARLNVFSTGGLTNLSFALEAPLQRLTNFTIQPAVFAVGGASLQLMTNNALWINLTARPGLFLQGAQEAALLSFSAVSNQTSAFIPLRLSGPMATKFDGALVTNVALYPGRVTVIGNEPLLEAMRGADGNMDLILYGRPDATYTLETSPTLAPPEWQDSQSLTLSNVTGVILLPPPTNASEFYRLRQ